MEQKQSKNPCQPGLRSDASEAQLCDMYNLTSNILHECLNGYCFTKKEKNWYISAEPFNRMIG